MRESLLDDTAPKTDTRRGFLRFSKRDFGLFCALFAIEVCIALFVRDRFIRPFVGDLLVVVLIYYFAKSFVRLPPRLLALGTLIFACSVEIAQYFKLVHLLGLQDSKLARVVLGATFDWLDFLAYGLGVALVLYLDETLWPPEADEARTTH